MERTDEGARLVLYFASHVMTPDTMARIREIKAIAKNVGIARHELLEVDLSSNLRLREKVAVEVGERRSGYPYIRLDGKLLQDGANLIALLTKPKENPQPTEAETPLTRSVSENYLPVKSGEDEEEDESPLSVYANIFESVRIARDEEMHEMSTELSQELEKSKIEVVEAAVHRPAPQAGKTKSHNRSMSEEDMNLLGRAGSLIEGALRGVLTWWYGEQPAPAKAKQVRNADDQVNFIVLQTNWYWRQQIRRLRIDKVAIERMHPETNVVKEVHGLGDISQIAISGNTFVTLFFSDGSRPEYYESRDRDHLVLELCVRARALTGRSVPIVTIRNTD